MSMTSLFLVFQERRFRGVTHNCAFAELKEKCQKVMESEKEKLYAEEKGELNK